MAESCNLIRQTFPNKCVFTIKIFTPSLQLNSKASHNAAIAVMEKFCAFVGLWEQKAMKTFSQKVFLILLGTNATINVTTFSKILVTNNRPQLTIESDLCCMPKMQFAVSCRQPTIAAANSLFSIQGHPESCIWRQTNTRQLQLKGLHSSIYRVSGTLSFLTNRAINIVVLI